MVGRAVAALQRRIQRQVAKPHGHRVGRSGARKQQRPKSAHAHQANTPCPPLPSEVLVPKPGVVGAQVADVKPRVDPGSESLPRAASCAGQHFFPNRGQPNPARSGSHRFSAGLRPIAPWSLRSLSHISPYTHRPVSTSEPTVCVGRDKRRDGGRTSVTRITRIRQPRAAQAAENEYVADGLARENLARAQREEAILWGGAGEGVGACEFGILHTWLWGPDLRAWAAHSFRSSDT